MAKPTDTVRAASFNVLRFWLLARAASRLHHARPPFFWPRGVSRSFLSPLRSFLSPPSLSCPMRNRMIFIYGSQQRLLAARSRCQVSHLSNPTPQPRSLPLSLPSCRPLLTDFLPIPLPYCSQDRPAARLWAGAAWSWLPRLSRAQATGGVVERARSGHDGRSPARTASVAASSGVPWREMCVRV